MNKFCLILLKEEMIRRTMYNLAMRRDNQLDHN
jgi:hypothetical protein